jgi:RHS repeat-associated protein
LKAIFNIPVKTGRIATQGAVLLDYVSTQSDGEIRFWGDYYPFGMLMPNRNSNSNSYAWGFNDKIKDDEISNVTGADLDYGARIYDSRVARWLSCDPIAMKFPWNSPYNAFSNNPISRIDPDGKGDFYTQAGKKIGTDGNPDGKIYVATDKNAIKTIKKNTHNDINTQVKDVQSSIVQLPSAEVRNEIGNAVDRSNSPTVDDVQGGFHEEGGVWGTISAGTEKVVNAKPGAYTNPVTHTKAEIDVSDPANPNEKGILSSTEGEFHIHPSGTVVTTTTQNDQAGMQNIVGGTTTTVHDFDQDPSKWDKKYATDPNKTYIAVGARYKTVYIYNSIGTKATFPLDKFISIGNEKEPKK